MKERPKMRVLRMAHSDPVRREVWDYLDREVRPHLVEAADANRVPVSMISARLLAQFGAKALEPITTRQFIGIAVSAILAEEGFVVARTGVRLRGDPLFTAGTMFERAPSWSPEGHNPLLARFIDTLSPDELAFAAARIRKRLQDLPAGQRKTRRKGSH